MKLCLIRNNNEIIKLCLIRNIKEIIKLRKNFTKTSLAKFDVYFFKHFTGTIPGDGPHRSFQLFQASRYRQFLHIAFVRDVDKDWGTLANSVPQTL